MPSKGGVVRDQSNELVPYADTTGWLVIPPDEAQIMLEKMARMKMLLEACEN